MAKKPKATIGDEYSWDSIPDDVDLQTWKCINYYRNLNDKQAKEWALEYFTHTVPDTEKVLAINNIDEYHFGGSRKIGYYLRMLTLGAPLNPILITKNNAELDEVLRVYGTPRSVTKRADKVSAGSGANDTSNAFISVLESQLDAVKKSEVILDMESVSKNLSKVKAWVAENLAKYQQNNDEFDKKQVKWLLSLAKICTKTEPVKKETVVKFRAKKVKPAGVQVANMVYCKGKSGFTSILPAKIIGCTKVFLLNSKTRNLTLLECDNKAGFWVKGTTIYGWDEKLSLTRKLRESKLAELALFETFGYRDTKAFMTKLNVKPGLVNGRCGEDTIILAAM